MKAADRFMHWVLWKHGVCAFTAPRIPFAQRQAMLNEWFALGQPYGVGL